MGQCACGEMNLVRLFRLPGSDVTLALDFYWGCESCGNPMDIVVRAFDPQGHADFVEGWSDRQVEELTPDDLGGNEGKGWRLPLIGTKEMIGAASVLDIDIMEYGNLGEIMYHHGLALLQKAFELRSES